MGRKLLKTVQTITTFRNPLADPVGTLWSADPSLKTAGDKSKMKRRAKTYKSARHNRKVAYTRAQLYSETELRDRASEVTTLWRYTNLLLLL